LLRHGQRPLTAASAGMAYAKELGYNWECLNESEDRKFRRWYFGGHVEAWAPGIHKGRFALWDIKSAYPWAMVHPHGVGREFAFIGSPRSVMGSDFLVVEGFSAGAFPVRDDTGREGLSYPHQQGRYYVTGWEYLAAVVWGLFRGRVLAAERPLATSDFRLYVDHWYAEKERAEREGDLAGRLIAKIMLNALYGKYAQSPDNFREYLIEDVTMEPEDGWEEEYIDEDNGFSIWSKPSDKPKRYYNVATAASITGFVRAMELRHHSETRSLYGDTDAGWCKRGLLPSGRGDRLGGWNVEVEADRLYIAGKKLYAARLLGKYCPDKKTAKKKGYYWDKTCQRGWKIASKGCRLNPMQMLKLCKGKTVKYKSASPCFSMHRLTSFVKRNIRQTA